MKVGCMRRRWLAVVSCSLIATGMYTRSFCEFLEEPHYTATVIHYHQWKINNFISQRTKLRFFTDLISFSLRTCPVESANAQDDFIAEMIFWLFKVQWLHLVEKFVAILCEIFSRFPIPKFIKIASILANYSHNDRVAFFGPQWIWQCFKTNACYYSFTPQKK